MCKHKNVQTAIIQFHIIAVHSLTELSGHSPQLCCAFIQKSNIGSKYSWCCWRCIGFFSKYVPHTISFYFRKLFLKPSHPLPTDSVHIPELFRDYFYSWRNFNLLFHVCLAGSGTESTGWQWTLMTIWTSTVLTTRVLRPTGAWSATSCLWSTTRATLPASTGCVASSAGSATVPAVLTDPCASLRSSSSSPPSPWALSSGLDTSTTISVGYQLGSVCFCMRLCVQVKGVCCVRASEHACVCACVLDTLLFYMHL